MQIGLGFFGQDAFDDLALAFGHLDVALVNIGRIKAAAAHARIAARKAVLFENNHFLSGFSSGHGSRQTGTARTDDDDIGVQRLGIGQQRRLRHFLFELSDIQSGLFQTLADGVLDGKARERGTRNGVDFYALMLDDVGNQFRLGQVSHRMRFGPINNLDVSNCIVFNRDLYIDRAVAAHRTGGVDAVLGKCRHRCSHRSSQSSRYGQSREFRNHVASPFLSFFNGKLSTSRANNRQQKKSGADSRQMKAKATRKNTVLFRSNRHGMEIRSSPRALTSFGTQNSQSRYGKNCNVIFCRPPVTFPIPTEKQLLAILCVFFSVCLVCRRPSIQWTDYPR